MSHENRYKRYSKKGKTKISHKKEKLKDKSKRK